jgi:FO synthase
MLERLFADVTPEVARMLDGALAGQELSQSDALRLLRSDGADLQALLRTADVARRDDKGDDVSFVINRNLNFTNICYVGCSFCGFSRHADDPDAYDRSM